MVTLPGVSGEGKLQLLLYVDGAPGYTMATLGVKKLGYVFATKKSSEISHFAVRSAMCVCHLTRKPPQRSKLCSSYCDVPTWSDCRLSQSPAAHLPLAQVSATAADGAEADALSPIL